MTDIQIFSRDVIPVYTTDEGNKVVMGRELHEKLGIKTPYHKWFPRMAEYGFVEGTDYFTEDKNVRRADGTQMPQAQVDHIMTLDMAKHIAMIQRTPQGYPPEAHRAGKRHHPAACTRFQRAAGHLRSR